MLTKTQYEAHYIQDCGRKGRATENIPTTASYANSRDIDDALSTSGPVTRNVPEEEAESTTSTAMQFGRSIFSVKGSSPGGNVRKNSPSQAMSTAWLGVILAYKSAALELVQGYDVFPCKKQRKAQNAGKRTFYW